MAQVAKKIYHLIRSGARAKLTRGVVDGNRVEVDTWDDYKIPAKYRTVDENGKSVVLRLLAECDSIDQAEQVKLGFPANLKFTERDGQLRLFKNGKLESTRSNQIAFFDSIPGNIAFKGDRGDYSVLFEEYIPQVAQKQNVDFGFKQAQAMVAAYNLDEATIDTKLIRLYGGTYQLPDTRDAKLEAIQDAINEATETSAALDIILETSETETIETTIGKAINAGVLSFIQKPDQVMIKREGQFVDFLKISADHTEQQKLDLFIDRLSASDGKVMLNAVKEALLKNANAPKVEEPIKLQEVVVPKELTDEELTLKYEAMMAKKKEEKDKEEAVALEKEKAKKKSTQN